MSALSRVLRSTTLALAMAATVTLAGTSGADAARMRIAGGGGHWHGGGGHWGGNWHHHGGCWGCWAGAGFVGGLALGALASPYYGYGYGYGPAYYDDYYGGCGLQRRVRYTAYGPVVRWVRVCY